MTKLLTFLSLVFCFSIGLRAQPGNVDSLKLLLKQFPQQDTLRVQRLNGLSFQLSRVDPLESQKIANDAIKLSKQLHYTAGETTGMLNISLAYTSQGNYVPALKVGLAALELAKRTGNKKLEALAYLGLAHTYQRLRNNAQALPYAMQALKLSRSINDWLGIRRSLNILGTIYATADNLPKAIDYYKQARQASVQDNDLFYVATMDGNLAEIYELQGKYDLAFSLSLRTVRFMETTNRPTVAAEFKLIPATAFLHTGQLDSAIIYAKQILLVTEPLGIRNQSRDAHKIMADAYAGRKDYARAWPHLQKYEAYRDSLAGEETTRQAAVLKYQIEQEKARNQIENLKNDQQLQALQQEKAQNEGRVLTWSLITGLVIFLVIGMILYRNNRQKQHANVVLQEEKQKVEDTLDELRATQKQLIQSEKMASLGELTAGIAHEIQNPLNFVNNFSEVSSELIEEMNVEIEKGNLEEIKTIANDILENLEKINHHGKRADNIVKGMLQHSKKSSSTKEPTDINALADEYLRLAYHGFRAKDNAFNTTLKTDFDETILLISIIPQDIGRVVLNLLNNAFYAVHQKVLLGSGYEPIVTLSTKKLGDNVLIRVQDNGSGIPKRVLDKIFQPFFTTKPTGQGTGLGLSLSYDIVTKGHGGTLQVESAEGDGSTFVVKL
ncbi:ATP-binding protein [Dyadobacter arcticus]|uniref:histidine kinase n=1 Tax=Dyadobacter arcticus TaxID=1078754 RepID=A0ABX0UMH2_9BACT|nr:ATP-binding protein [Dyadobacter arcticus]NIJ54212.1 signal transduction histidine kinase [Dyadobacter arcticus]